MSEQNNDTRVVLSNTVSGLKKQYNTIKTTEQMLHWILNKPKTKKITQVCTLNVIIVYQLSLDVIIETHLSLLRGWASIRGGSWLYLKGDPENVITDSGDGRREPNVTKWIK